MMRGIAQTQQRDRGTVYRLTLPVLTLLVVPLTLARCAATEQTPQAPQAPQGNGAFLEVLSERAPSADAHVQSQVLEPTRPTVERWATVGEGAPFEIRASVTGSEGNERWTRTEPAATRVLARTAADEVTLIEQTDSSDGATTRFLQPLILAPADLRVGEECTSTSVVLTLRGDAIDNDGGRAQRSMKLASEDRIRTPLGECDASRIDSVFTMKVPFASMRRETSIWVRAGDGPVAIRSVEKILVMGVVPRNRSETRVRLPATGLTP